MSLDTDRLMKNVRTRVPGATDDAIRLELFNTLNEFFQDSNIWKEDISFAVKATDDPTTTTYFIEAESVSSINRLIWILNSAGKPVSGTMATPGAIILDQQPGQNDTYTATVALTVNDPVAKDGFPEFPAWILNKYGTGVYDGVMARLMSQPAKPYTNVNLGAYHMREFRSTVAQAKYEALHLNVNNMQTWRYPQSFATRRR